MAPKVFGLFVAFALLTAACGVIGDETPTPTPDVPTFSREAVIGLVATACRAPYLAAAIRSKAEAVYRGNGAWAVEYGSPPGGPTRWEVYEPGGLVVPLGHSGVHIACQKGSSE